jgi:hypothetical protein
VRKLGAGRNVTYKRRRGQRSERVVETTFVFVQVTQRARETLTQLISEPTCTVPRSGLRILIEYLTYARDRAIGYVRSNYDRDLRFRSSFFTTSTDPRGLPIVTLLQLIHVSPDVW